MPSFLSRSYLLQLSPLPVSTHTLSLPTLSQGAFCAWLWFKSGKKWKRRWGVVDTTDARLLLFKDPKDDGERESFALSSGSVERDQEKKKGAVSNELSNQYWSGSGSR